METVKTYQHVLLCFYDISRLFQGNYNLNVLVVIFLVILLDNQEFYALQTDTMNKHQSQQVFVSCVYVSLRRIRSSDIWVYINIACTLCTFGSRPLQVATVIDSHARIRSCQHHLLTLSSYVVLDESSTARVKRCTRDREDVTRDRDVKTFGPKGEKRCLMIRCPPPQSQAPVEHRSKFLMLVLA